MRLATSAVAIILPTVFCAGGCWVPQGQDVPVPATHHVEPVTRTSYWRYVPKGYHSGRKWPLVVTLHGTRVPAYDTYDKQIDEWKLLAEEKQFIVVAPQLGINSTQGILPVIRSTWLDDLAKDETVILAVIDEVCGQFNVDGGCVMMTGFSSGGYPLYWTGLRNPKRFQALVARACNSSMTIFEHIEITDDARRLPVLIYWGKSDFQPIQDWSWQAYRYLRERGCTLVTRKEVEGGHIRRPEIAYQYWSELLPPEYRR